MSGLLGQSFYVLINFLQTKTMPQLKMIFSLFFFFKSAFVKPKATKQSA